MRFFLFNQVDPIKNASLFVMLYYSQHLTKDNWKLLIKLTFYVYQIELGNRYFY